jgi:hypothetical protein
MAGVPMIDWVLLTSSLAAGVILLGLFARACQSTLDGDFPRFRLKALLALITSLCLMAAGASKYPAVTMIVGLPFVLISMVWVVSVLLGRPPVDDSLHSDDDQSPEQS